jgi:SAM-dependent methyltransferase
MNQKLIWDHFQVEGIQSFDGSIPRLSFLVNQALKISKKSHLSEPKVLNIGVGNGWLENQCVKQRWKTYALDPSEKAIERLESNQITGKVGLIEAIPYQDNFFDVVFCSEVIEHLSEEQFKLGLQEINRILVQGGCLIGTVPFQENLADSEVVCPDCGHIFHKWGHQQSFDIPTLAKIFPSGMKVKKIKVIYFIDWASLNWKGVLVGFIKKALSILGVHGKNENLFFIVEKCD